MRVAILGLVTTILMSSTLGTPVLSNIGARQTLNSAEQEEWVNPYVADAMLAMNVVGYMCDRISGELFGNNGIGEFIIDLDKE